MSIVLEQLVKRYEGHVVVNRVSLEVGEGELFVLIGPSGSGKSTILRMIAGLNSVDAGRIWLHGRDVTQAPVQTRGVGFVFQNYALFKHMTVADNIEFALRVRRVTPPERRKRRDELLELVGLAGLGQRRPSQLSGGQQQRVALARALAHRPEVLLLDEPFGALDAKIRVELRRALKRIQAELRITTIFVTHDQEEAFELAHRVGVMNFGRVLEIGRPSELYQRPQTEFVATFLGTANLLVGQCDARGVQVGPMHFPLHTEFTESTPRRAQVLFRPEDVALSPEPVANSSLTLGAGTVEQLTFVGAFERVRLRLPAMPGVRLIAPALPFGEDAIAVEAQRTPDETRRWPLTVGQTAWVGVRHIHALSHPGLNFLLLTNGRGLTALRLGGQMARYANARVTVATYDLRTEDWPRHWQTLKDQLGSGLTNVDIHPRFEPLAATVALEAEQQPFDVAFISADGSDGVALAEQVLQTGEHHVVLVPEGEAAPTIQRALICSAGGEPGKEDVRFTGRLLRHLGAEATLLSVVPAENVGRERAERFLADGARTLEQLGVRTQTALRVGHARDEIVAYLQAQPHDLVALGAPLPATVRGFALSGITAQVLKAAAHLTCLVVRSQPPVLPNLGAYIPRRLKIYEGV